MTNPYFDSTYDEVTYRIRAFVETVAAFSFAVVLMFWEYLKMLAPTRKSFRGETILITGKPE